MIRGDPSVWIDYFRGTATPQAERLDARLGSELLIIGDLTPTEVLQSFGSQRDFDQARNLLTRLDAVDIGGRDIAIQAAQRPRAARAWHHDPQDNRRADRHPLHRIGLRAVLQRPRLRPICHTSRAEFGDELNRAEVEEGGEIRGNVAASPIVQKIDKRSILRLPFGSSQLFRLMPEKLFLVDQPIKAIPAHNNPAVVGSGTAATGLAST